MLSWQSKHGASFMIYNPYSTRFSKPISSQIVWWWMLLILAMLLMLGKASSKAGRSSSMELHGELAQVPRLTFGVTTSFQQKIILGLFLHACRGCHPIRLTTLLIVQRVWKEQVLDRYFFEFEAAVIKRIPLCRNSLPTKTNRVKRKVIVEVYMITVSNNKRILPMLCTIAQTWTIFGPRYHSGTTVTLNKAWVSLRCLVLFLPRIETLNYLSQWYGRFGIVVTISDWASPWYLWVSYCS